MPQMSLLLGQPMTGPLKCVIVEKAKLKAGPIFISFYLCPPRFISRKFGLASVRNS